MHIKTKLLAVILILNQAFASGGSGEHSEGGWVEKWLSFDPGIFFWTVVTFLLVLGVLWWKAWGPLMTALDTREANIRESLSAADKAREEADQVSRDYEEMVKRARVEAQQIVAEGKAAGEKVKAVIEDEARGKAAELVEKARDQIVAEKEKAVHEIKSIVVDLSIEAASKVIEKNLDTEDNRKLVNKTLTEIGKA